MGIITLMRSITDVNKTYFLKRAIHTIIGHPLNIQFDLVFACRLMNLIEEYVGINLYHCSSPLSDMP